MINIPKDTQRRAYLYRAMLVTLSLLLVVGCGAGPTKRSVDGAWSVSENICSTDPNNSEKGDIRSDIRTKSNGLNAQRIVSIYYLNKTILKLNNNATPSGITGKMTVYENTPENSVIRTQEARNIKEINNGLKKAVVDFFENDPDVDGTEASSFCLYRGQ